MDAIILSTLEELKTQLTTIQTDLVLLRFDVEQIRDQLDRMEEKVNETPAEDLNSGNWHVEKL